MSEVYCICRKGERGSMVQCDRCNDWYHLDCIHMTQAEADRIRTYICPVCEDESASKSSHSASPRRKPSGRESAADPEPKDVKSKKATYPAAKKARPASEGAAATGAVRAVRDTVIRQLVEALKKALPDQAEGELIPMATAIELALIQLYPVVTNRAGVSLSSEYKVQFRSLVFNLGDNPDLAKALMAGGEAPSTLVRRSASELASAHQKETVRRLEEAAGKASENLVVSTENAELVLKSLHGFDYSSIRTDTASAEGDLNVNLGAGPTDLSSSLSEEISFEEGSDESQEDADVLSEAAAEVSVSSPLGRRQSALADSASAPSVPLMKNDLFRLDNSQFQFDVDMDDDVEEEKERKRKRAEEEEVLEAEELRSKRAEREAEEERRKRSLPSSNPVEKTGWEEPAADPEGGVVWEGVISREEFGRVRVRAHRVHGPRPPMEHIPAEGARFDGSLQLHKVAKYLLQLGSSRSRVYSLLVLEPAGSADQSGFQALLEYLRSNDRAAGVVNMPPSPQNPITDFFLLPITPSDRFFRDILSVEHGAKLVAIYVWRSS